MRFRDRSAFPIVGNFLKTVHGLRSLWFAITCFPRARSINRCCKSSTAKNDAAKPVRGDALRATRGFSAQCSTQSRDTWDQLPAADGA